MNRSITKVQNSVIKNPQGSNMPTPKAPLIFDSEEEVNR
jgi:hypothetical protein